MLKRTATVFIFFVLAMFAGVLAVYHLTDGEWLAQAAERQQTDTLTVSATRGTIYDRNLDALTGTGKEEYPAAIVPGGDAAAALGRACSASQMEPLRELLAQGKPFTALLPKNISAPGIDVFPQRRRYSADGVAAHVIGYLNGSGNGAAGVEKAFDRQLASGAGRVQVSYQVDAVGRAFPGDQKTVSNQSALRKRGVVLTIDASIQRLAERSAARHLKKGAAVVLEVPTGKIVALASLPSFPQENVASVLNSADSPLLNRAVSAYSVGSVFKICAAAAALEDGISPATSFECTGSVDVDGQAFHCFDGERHGKENMKQAITNSCNTYFVKLMQKVPPADFLRMSQNLGFGRAFQLAPGMSSDAGDLPGLASLSVKRALANFSFGQGSLTATPLQIAAMVNAVASDGVFTQPTIYAGQVDEDLHFTETPAAQKSARVMSQQTAALLRDFMKASIDSGTSRKGKPDYGTAGAKTATAQTGVFVNGTEQVESWFAGFYPYDHPKFVVAVFAEGGDGGGTTCGPVFREIADGLYGYVS